MFPVRSTGGRWGWRECCSTCCVPSRSSSRPQNIACNRLLQGKAANLVQQVKVLFAAAADTKHTKLLGIGFWMSTGSLTLAVNCEAYMQETTEAQSTHHGRPKLPHWQGSSTEASAIPAQPAHLPRHSVPAHSCTEYRHTVQASDLRLYYTVCEACVFAKHACTCTKTKLKLAAYVAARAFP